MAHVRNRLLAACLLAAMPAMPALAQGDPLSIRQRDEGERIQREYRDSVRERDNAAERARQLRLRSDQTPEPQRVVPGAQPGPARAPDPGADAALRMERREQERRLIDERDQGARRLDEKERDERRARERLPAPPARRAQ